MGAFDWAGGTDTGTKKAKKPPPFSWAGGGEAAPRKPGSLDNIFNPAPNAGVGAVLKPVWEGTASAGRGLIDLLSRPMFAVAGAAEETLSPEGGGLAAVPGRVGSELFSGLPGVQGQKRNFNQAMERAGVGELAKLSDALPIYNETGEGPALQRGGWADPTLRGAIGLALDIGLDPTTYLTAGGAAARKFVTKAGVRYLSPAGMETLASIQKGMQPVHDTLLASGDSALRVTGMRQVSETIRDKMEKAIASDPKLLDKTGIKWFGQEVVSKKTLEGLSSKMKEAVLSVPGGSRAARAASGFRDGMRRLFDPFAEIAGLDPDARAGVANTIRDYHNTVAADSFQQFAKWAPLEAEERRLAGRYGKGDTGIQALGKKFSDWREGTGAPKLTPEESTLFGKVAGMYDDIGKRLVGNGILKKEQWEAYAGKYLRHDYKNKEVLSETVSAARNSGLLGQGRFTKEREFDTLADAVRISAGIRKHGLAQRVRGGTEAVYGALVPEYGMTRNLAKHIEESGQSLWRDKMFTEIRDKYGLDAGKAGFDASRVHELHSPIEVGTADRAAIDALVDGHTKLSDLAAASGKDMVEGWDNTAKAAKALLPKLSADGQKELARTLVSMAHSPGQLFRIEEAVGEKLMPEIKAVKAGDIEPFFLKHGLPEEKARLVPVKGGLWGEKEHLIPQAIYNMVEQMPRDIVMDAAVKAHIGWMVKGYDKYNNLFKGMTYPFWPAGATRDLYNNLQQSFLSLGVGGLARPGIAAKIHAGSDAAIQIGAHKFTGKQWKTIAEDLRVTDPSASSFVQFTGQEGAKKSGLYAKARAFRGNVDNVTRTQLFVNGVGQGMTLQDAARMVHEFHFNYSELSAFDRDVMRRIIPFYVFPRKAIGVYAKQAVQNPGRVINMAKPFLGRDDENQAMTAWEGEGFKMRLDRNGKDITMINGVDLPVRSLDMLWKGTPGKTVDGLLAMMSPAIKAPYEWRSGKDPFTGQELGRRDRHTLGLLVEKLPKFAQDLVGFKKEFDKAGRPKYMMRDDRVQPLIEAAAVSRFFSTPDRVFREQIREPNKAARWLDFLTGLRFKTLNLDEEQQKKVFYATKAAEEELVNQGAAKEFKRVYVPKAK